MRYFSGIVFRVKSHNKGFIVYNDKVILKIKTY